MTREEAIKRFESMRKDAQVVLDSGFGTQPGECDTLYRRRVELADIALLALHEQEQNRWIPVTERLPEESSYFLCYWKGHTCRCKYWRHHDRFEFNGRPVKVTHWMPLPEPPKEVER